MRRAGSLFRYSVKTPSQQVCDAFAGVNADSKQFDQAIARLRSDAAEREQIESHKHQLLLPYLRDALLAIKLNKMGLLEYAATQGFYAANNLGGVSPVCLNKLIALLEVKVVSSDPTHDPLMLSCQQGSPLMIQHFAEHYATLLENRIHVQFKPMIERRIRDGMKALAERHDLSTEGWLFEAMKDKFKHVAPAVVQVPTWGVFAGVVPPSPEVLKPVSTPISLYWWALGGCGVAVVLAVVACAALYEFDREDTGKALNALFGGKWDFPNKDIEYGTKSTVFFAGTAVVGALSGTAAGVTRRSCCSPSE